MLRYMRNAVCLYFSPVVCTSSACLQHILPPTFTDPKGYASIVYIYFRILRFCNFLIICGTSCYHKDIAQPYGCLICANVFSPDCSLPFLLHFLYTWKMSLNTIVCVHTHQYIIYLVKKFTYH